jgi:hypothetical protein
MDKFNPNKLTDDELRLCHNLYNKKWRAKHKDSVSASNIEYYKKCKGITKCIKSEVVDVGSLILNRV